MGYECCEGGCRKDVRVSFCPSCKSRSVGYVFTFGNLFGVIPKMRCRDCGFDASTFPVLIADEAELKKAVEGMKSRKKKTVKKKVIRRKR